MARDRQKAKARKARRAKAGQRPAGSDQPTQAREEEPTSAGMAPPQDVGFTNTDGSEVKEELKAERKAAKSKAKQAPAKAAAAKKEPKQRGRFISFLRSSWAELRRVQWPDRKQITTMSTIVIGFVIIAGAYLGIIDWVANEMVNLII